MSNTILGGDLTVYYEAENRQQRIKWTGAAGDTREVSEVYSALMDLFDQAAQMDDGVPMKYDTPREYRIGIIDAGDDDPWFMDRDTIEHLTGGSIITQDWKRVEGSNTGVIRVPCNNTNIVAGDIGYDIVGDSDSDTGTLLDVKGTGAGSELWIRPDDDTAANSFDNASQGLTCNTHTATQSGSPATGESVFANLYTLGSWDQKTIAYIYQDGGELVGYKTGEKYWPETGGDIDILVCVKECDTEIDEGYLIVFPHQYSYTYFYYELDVTAGGRNPVPLSTQEDINNTTGYRQFTGSSGSNTFNVGNGIYVGSTWATATKRGRLTAVGGTTGSPILSYYLMGDLTDFANTDAVKEYDFQTGADGDATCTAGTPSDIGPAALSGLSITHAADNTHDIDEDGTNEYFSIDIDCSDELVADVYEWLKYICRRGQTATGNTDGQEAESYIGNTYRVEYTSITGSISEGAEVTQYSGGYGVGYVAKGTVVAHHLTPDILILRSHRDTFNNTNPIYVDGSNYVSGPTCTPLTTTPACPFGTFAGGRFFGAPGVVLSNVNSADANNYQLIDDEGNGVQVPTKVNAVIGNTREDDWCAMFRLTAAGGQIKKDTYTVDTVQAIGDTTISVDPNIASTEPGKTTGGVLFVVDVDADTEYRYRFTGWSGDDFTLYNKAADAAEAGTTTTKIVATGGFTGCKVGDIIYNSTRTAHTYISEIVDDDEVNVFPAIANQASGDNFRVGALAAALTTSDKVYVPIIHSYETVGDDGSPGSESANVVYSADVPVRVRVRNAGDIQPFEQDGTLGNTGVTINAVRNADTVYA